MLESPTRSRSRARSKGAGADGLRRCPLFRVVLVTFVAVLGLSGCGDDVAGPSGPQDLQITDLRVGTGDEAVAGSTVSVDYTGWLWEAGAPDNKGTQFDTSSGRGPFTFVLGAGQVIAGWDQGVAGMREGGLRRLVIPPGLAYGAQGRGAIPPNATLIFDVDLLDVQ